MQNSFNVKLNKNKEILNDYKEKLKQLQDIQNQDCNDASM